MRFRRTVLSLVAVGVMTALIAGAAGISPASALPSTASQLKTLNSQVKTLRSQVATLRSQMASVYKRLTAVEAAAKVPGPAGAKGDAGPAGAKGDTGTAGPQGEAGVAGSVGATGPAGPKGDSGSAGLRGERGPAGPQGLSADAAEAAFWPADAIRVIPETTFYDWNGQVQINFYAKTYCGGTRIPAKEVWAIVHLPGGDVRPLMFGGDDTVVFVPPAELEPDLGSEFTIEYWITAHGQLIHDASTFTVGPATG